MVPETIKIKVGGTFEGSVRAIVPEGFFDKLDHAGQFDWASKYIREMKVNRLMEELKLNRVEAVKVLDVLDIFDRPLVEYIQKGDSLSSQQGDLGGTTPSP